MMRLFMGVELPEDVRRTLLAIMGGVDGARWQSFEQLHMTLRFIGETSETAATDIDLALQGVRVDPFEVAAKGVGVFGTGKRPRIIWAGLKPEAPLGLLHQRIESALIRTGLAPDRRKYSPHITLARLKNRAGRLDRFVAEHSDLTSDSWTIDRITLFRSHLARKGAIYEPLAHYPVEF